MTSRIAALAGLILSSCTHSHDGVAVSLGVAHSPGRSWAQPNASAEVPGNEAEAATLVTDLGYRVTLSEARLTVASWGLVPCEEHAAVRFFRRHVTLMGTAYAHGAGEPTLYEHSYTHDLLSERASRVEVGIFSPPADTYCGVHVALGSEASPALALDGQQKAPGDGEAAPFSLIVAGRQHVALDFATPFALDAEQPQASLTLELAYGGWLDGVTLEGDADAAAKVLTAIKETAIVAVSR